MSKRPELSPKTESFVPIAQLGIAHFIHSPPRPGRIALLSNIVFNEKIFKLRIFIITIPKSAF
jgi:hypothetical protein